MSEWEKNNSLSDPSDVDKNIPWSTEGNNIDLSEEQCKQAVKDLSVYHMQTFPRIEKRFFDEPFEQCIGLFSFVPAKGATPNKKGFYGWIKHRGGFTSGKQAKDRALELVKNDSYHRIHHAPVGHPVPLTTRMDLAKEIEEVDVNKELSETISEDVKKKREKEEKEMEEIKDREKKLLEDVKKPPQENRSDYYTTLKTKKAQLSWTYLENEKKLIEISGLIAKARYEIEELDKEDPTLQEQFLNKYLEARKEANLPVDKDVFKDTFMKYLVEDVKIPAVEEEYRKMYQS